MLTSIIRSHPLGRGAGDRPRQHHSRVDDDVEPAEIPRPSARPPRSPAPDWSRPPRPPVRCGRRPRSLGELFDPVSAPATRATFAPPAAARRSLLRRCRCSLRSPEPLRLQVCVAVHSLLVAVNPRLPPGNILEPSRCTLPKSVFGSRHGNRHPGTNSTRLLIADVDGSKG